MRRNPPPQALLDCAVAASRAAGRHALTHRARRGCALRTLRHDVKLELDVECQQIAEGVIRKRFPSHSILGEESATRANDIPPASVYQWIIDPIDGTVNFSHGLPWWCCSIAVRLGGQTLAGAVFAPQVKELYTASRGSPARLNGAAIHVSAVSRLSRALIMTGLDKKITPGLPPFAIFEDLSARVQKTRVFGSAALDLCLVAGGRADGYFESGIYIWDVAAAGLIVQQAGGRADIVKIQDDSRLCFAASNGKIHRALLRVVSVSALPVRNSYKQQEDLNRRPQRQRRDLPMTACTAGGSDACTRA